MPEDLPVTKCIHVIVGITRNKVILTVFARFWFRLTTEPMDMSMSETNPTFGSSTPLFVDFGNQ